MNITLNGNPTEVDDGITLTTLLEARFESSDGLAVAINREVVPKAKHEQTTLNPGDAVEVIHAVGGG